MDHLDRKAKARDNHPAYDKFRHPHQTTGAKSKALAKKLKVKSEGESTRFTVTTKRGVGKLHPLVSKNNFNSHPQDGYSYKKR